MKITNTKGRMRPNDVLEFIENVGTGFWKEYKKGKENINLEIPEAVIDEFIAYVTINYWVECSLLKGHDLEQTYVDEECELKLDFKLLKEKMQNLAKKYNDGGICKTVIDNKKFMNNSLAEEFSEQDGKEIINQMIQYGLKFLETE